jgi:hypothetical protein
MTEEEEAEKEKEKEEDEKKGGRKKGKINPSLRF